jgi:hypothetical protein
VCPFEGGSGLALGNDALWARDPEKVTSYFLLAGCPEKEQRVGGHFIREMEKVLNDSRPLSLPFLCPDGNAFSSA